MRITDLRQEPHRERIRTCGTVIWEDSDRSPQDIFFETDPQFSDALTAATHALLVAGIVPALRHGEGRIAVDGEVCPHLKLGLANVMQLLQHWYGYPHPVTIEAAAQRVPHPRGGSRAAFFFTGGVDSLTTLRVNRQLFPPDHPGSFRDGLIIFGLEIDDQSAFQHVLDVLGPLAARNGITMLPIYTNVRSLDEDWVFWADQFEGAVLSSAAHALGQRLASASIGSSYDHPHLHPHGSHPLLDPNYSSADLQILHDGVGLSRLDKTRILADWPDGIRSLHVCNRGEAYRPGVLNCGRCEKCLRTLTALLVLDRLDDAASFGNRDVTPALLEPKLDMNPMTLPFWKELIDPLRRKGCDDLARLISGSVREYETNGGWKGSVVRFDRDYFGGRLLRARHRMRAVAASRS